MGKGILITAPVIIAASMVYLYITYSNPALSINAQQQSPPAIATTTETPVRTEPISAMQTISTSSLTFTPGTDHHPGMKLYRNDQWGFEFWYPEGWGIEENTYRQPSY